MRSLFIEYPRPDSDVDIFAGLLTLHQADLNINLPVVNADHSGITVIFPTLLTGMFYIKIQDGDQAFMEKVAIQ